MNPVSVLQARENSRIGLLALMLAVAPAVSASILYDESVSGDLSGDYLNPTPAGGLQYGDNVIKGTTGSLNRDYLTFSIAPGHRLASLTLSGYVSLDDKSFLGITAGTDSIDPATAGANIASLLGYTLPGTANTTALLGTDILDDLAAGAGAQGFNIPLGPGDYTLWIQEGGTAGVDYELTLTTVPETTAPSVALGLFLVGAGVVRRSRRMH